MAALNRAQLERAVCVASMSRYRQVLKTHKTPEEIIRVYKIFYSESTARAMAKLVRACAAMDAATE